MPASPFPNPFLDAWIAWFPAWLGADQQATKEELQMELREARQIVASQQTTIEHYQLMLGDNPSLFEALRREIREAWGNAGEYSAVSRASLTVLHGLAERCTVHNQRSINFFKTYMRHIRRGTADPVEVEAEARILGLPVCDAEEDPTSIACQFGYVNAIEDGIARISMMDNDGVGVSCVLEVPENWIPKAYRDDTAHVAWVERTYPSGVKGRFEPASGGPVV